LKSETTQQDQPLCFECTDFFVADLEARLKASEQEREACCSILEDLLAEEASSSSQLQPLRKELPLLEKEEAALLKELGHLQREQEDVQRQAALAERQQEELDAQCEEHWRAYNACLVADMMVAERRMSLDQHLQMEVEELAQLNRTNILNEAFHIWFDGHFGTINNFRLGKTPSEQVEWNEINAAWGHAALLLSTVARLRCVPWLKHQVVPMGSFSTVEPGRYELYGGAPVFWASSRFDKAMVGFLWCLNEVLQAERARTQEPVPYDIQDDKIGGLTIKLAANEPDQWTRALKFVLTNLKWLVGALSSHPLLPPDAT
jgi:beclin 1